MDSNKFDFFDVGQNVVDPSLVSPPNNFSSFDGSRRDVVAKDPFSPGKHGYNLL